LATRLPGRYRDGAVDQRRRAGTRRAESGEGGGAGARLALGGKAVAGKGYFYPPTLLLDVRQEMDIIHEETFGPVLPVVAFDTLDEALAMANDSDYGLTSSIYTRDLNVAMKAIKG
jgi:lactaldehyde dehydrogenase/glycolaldehyde dehydrogenase